MPQMRYARQMDTPQATQFAIMTAPARRALIEGAAEQFEAWMRSAYPGYEFRVVEPIGELVEDGDTLVVPVLGSVGDGFTDKPLASPPDRTVIEAITERVIAFTLQGSTH